MHPIHWSERLAKEVLNRDPPYTITAGITTSGPAHLGTICEFLFPYVIKRKIEEFGGEARFIFIGDIRDAFDSIPAVLSNYKNQLEPHIGKPLSRVPDPFGCHKSYGEHFLEEVKEIMNEMNVEAEIITADELYSSGAFDKYAFLYLSRLEEVKQIVEQTSGRQLPKSWNPIMPICAKCGRIDKTKIIDYDLNGNYRYMCKACGHKGEAHIRDHEYKLQWRLHWPAWQNYFNTTIEGGGVDHFTRGGSWDTAKEIHKKIFGKKPPIDFKYGFIMIQGKKYSKSKARGLGAKELLKLLPPEVIKYHLLKYDLQENIDFNPTKENILFVIEDYERAWKIEKPKTRAEMKKKAAFNLAEGRKWKPTFREALLYYIIYKNWRSVEEHIGKVSGIIKPYIENWLKMEFIPDDYDFSYKPVKAEGAVKEFLLSLKDQMSPLDIHNAVYEFARSKGIEPKEFFKALYKTLIGKDRGPRLGRLIHALGIQRIKRDCL